MQKVLLKSDLNDFLAKLMKKYELLAPVKQDNITKFKIIKNPEEIYLEGLTTLEPAKKFFLPENEVLLEYNNNKVTEVNRETKKRIIFGMRKCDINALLVLDKIMHDPKYIQKRQNTIIIGLHCENPDKYCFCNSMELKDEGYDLFFYPYKNNYNISIGSKNSQALVRDLPDAKTEIKLQIKNKRTLKNKDIEKDYQNKIWETDSEKCLSCTACTVYCPTCNCFNIEDLSDIGLKNGKRIRQQASCQLKSFSEVAGGKAFRDSRLSRFKHFVYHKISYFKKQHDCYMCVGCGRCLRVCPTKIDWVKTANLLGDFKGERVKKHG